MLKTKNYKMYKYPFQYFNEVQTEVLEVLKEKGDKNNLVLSANTSSGKTICAEFLIDQELKKGNKIVYLSPLKALAEERLEDWRKRFKNQKITILTSDYQYTKNLSRELNDSDLLVLTSEMLDSKSRNYNEEKDLWLKEVGLLIVDESHIISNETRGAAVEVSIIRFTLLNKKTRIMFLSATMSNCLDFQNWLMMLNGKKTNVVESTWRPVELNFHFQIVNPVYVLSNHISRPFFDYFETEKAKVEEVISIILEKIDKEKFLVFVHSKATGRKVVSRLEEEGVDSIFHNADLKRDSRRRIEDDFKDKDGELRVLVSTSTLAWGVNLPARNVIIVGTKRGLNDVDPLDIIQMAGRAGRYGIDDEGDVYLILFSGMIETWRKIFENPRFLNSMLESPRVLAFHALAEINNGIIKSEIELRRWYRRTLNYLQTMKVPICVYNLIPSLRRIFMIKDSYPLETTNLGKISSRLYFSPYDISGWYHNCRSILDIPKINDYHLSCTLFNVPKNEMWIPKDLEPTLSDFYYDLTSRGLKCSGKSLMHVFVGYNCLTDESPMYGIFASLKREILFDFGRVVSAVKMVVSTLPKSLNKDRLMHIVNSAFLRITYGVPEEAIELVKIPGIGSKRALALVNIGIHNAKDIVNLKNKREILQVFSSRVYKTAVSTSVDYLKEQRKRKVLNPNKEL